MASPGVLAADWTWMGDRFEAGIAVAVGEDGRIQAVGGERDLGPAARLSGRALLPGLVSAHSHAFQRGLRGRGESFPAQAGSFWTWREAMYELAARLGANEIESLCRQAFGEMRRAGITAVGEFHYLHHGPGDLDWSLDLRLLAAARQAGIRLVLLEAYYRTGSIGEPLGPAQRRFESPGPGAFWQQMDRLAGCLDPSTQSLGAAVHSIRAASLEDLAEIHSEARRRGLPVHMHVEEQRREIDEALARYGRRPMALILDALGGAEGLTAVHCTHTAPDDLDRFLDQGGTLCVCPLTEANLGDGLPDLPPAAAAGGWLCLGSDSNARISMLEEMRWLEYGQRLKRESRGVLADARGEVAASLLAAATTGGARALGLDAGRIAPGHWADFVVIDLAAPALAGWEPASLAAALVFGCGEEVIAATCVGGVWSDQAEPARDDR
jgi:formimidoylglutamate deiminase